jgi:hypothetical protein
MLLEDFPVGKRLAYDPARGLLWAVCARCGRWNLAPLQEDERWRSIEQLEQHFSSVPTRASSNGIGIAEVAGGASLVRVGDAPWPEFAAWRYGRRFIRRRYWWWVTSLVIPVLGSRLPDSMWALLLTAGGLTVLGALVAQGIWAQVYRKVWRVPLPDGSRAIMRTRHLQKVRFHVEGSDWHVVVRHDLGETALYGREALRAATVLLPRCNYKGAGEREVQTAIEMIERAGGPARAFTKWFTVNFERGWDGALFNLEGPVALALEMATQEENERRTLRGELALLAPDAWVAHQTAAIVDELA